MTFKKNNKPWNKGKKHSVENREKMKKNHWSKTKVYTPKPWNKGKKCPQITKSLIGRKPWNKGKEGCFTEETKKRLVIH